jgi:hypothetical protein
VRQVLQNPPSSFTCQIRSRILGASKLMPTDPFHDVLGTETNVFLSVVALSFGVRLGYCNGHLFPIPLLMVS